VSWGGLCRDNICEGCNHHFHIGDELSYVKRVWANKSSRKLIIVASIVVAVCIAFENRDIDVHGVGGWGTFIGQANSATYLGRSPSNPSFYKQTELGWQSKGSFQKLHLCGDQADEFSPGKNYRIDVKVIEWGHHDGFVLDCQRLLTVEEIPERVEIGQLSGHVDTVKMSDYYAFTVDIISTDGVRQKLSLCDDDMFQSEREVYKEIELLERNPGWTLVTLFYNKAAKSAHFGCFPLMVIRNEKTGDMTETEAGALFYPVQKQLVDRFQIPGLTKRN
jgi:hypothetical protein